MADESWPAKGKSKRLAEDSGVDDRDEASNQELRPHPRLRLFTATAIATETSQRQYGDHTSQERLQSGQTSASTSTKPFSATRITFSTFLRDDKVWTDMDIIFFHLFLVKLDTRLSDPILGNGMCELSHMLLTQKSLSLLYKVLTKKVVLDYDEATDMLVRTYLSKDLDTDTHTW
ncbi:MAG: hypothetical protein Q9179_006911 [Wetmoreana sp. 5 TL-2023]